MDGAYLIAEVTVFYSNFETRRALQRCRLLATRRFTKVLRRPVCHHGVLTSLTPTYYNFIYLYTTVNGLIIYGRATLGDASYFWQQ